MATPVSGLCMGCMTALGEHTVCSRCGYDNGAPHDMNYRRPGSILGSRYVLGRLVRKNGEGALYMGYDNNLKYRVWIREYYPHTIVTRNIATGDVLPREGCGAQYKALMSDFIDVCNEVKRLGVTEPVIPIENVVGECGTVYAVYKDLDVIPLDTWLGRRGGKLPLKDARDLLLPMFNTLSNIHTRSDIHRGISPYTVYIDRDDNLYLWDFCMSAARTGGSELEAELFNGYSAPEQYVVSGWQGTWTDVYGAAALFYRAVSGFVPPRSTLIGDQRPLAPLIDLVMDIPKNISDAVADAMNPDAERRTQEIGSFIASLVGTNLSSTAVYDVNKVSEVKRARQEKRQRREESRRRGKYVVIGMLVTVLALFGIIYFIMVSYFPELIHGDEGSETSPPATTSSQPEESEESTSSEPQPDNSMPDLTGMTAAEAEAAYSGRFVFSVQEDYNDQFPEGQIYNTSPSKGVTIADGRTVILHISKGKRTLVIPEKIIGMTRDEAREEMAKLGNDGGSAVTYDEFERFQQDAPPGTVIGTSPAPGTEFDPQDTRITLFFMPGEPEDDSVPEVQSNEDSSRPSDSDGESSRKTVSEFEEEWGERDRDPVR